MKIRNGFVSNSSSSSFIMITKKEHFEAVLEELDKIQVDFLRSIVLSNNFNGMDLVSFYTIMSDGYSTTDEFMDTIDEEDLEKYEEILDLAYGAVGDLIKAIENKFGENTCIYFSEDF